MLSLVFTIFCIYIFLDDVCKCLDGLESTQNESAEKIDFLEKEISLLKSLK